MSAIVSRFQELDVSHRFLHVLIWFNVLPHMPDHPVWISVMALLFLVWRLLGDMSHRPSPRRWLTGGLSIVCALGVFLQYKTLLGQEPGASLLLLLAGLKFLEVRAYRDYMVMAFLALLLLMAKLLINQSILLTTFLFLDVTLVTFYLLYLHNPNQRLDFGNLWKSTLVLTLQAVPLLVLLFVVFPRFSTAFVRRQQIPIEASSGFSNEVNPGSVAKLASSNQLAFRVSFPNQSVPGRRDLYFRGGVLSEAHGLKWTEGDPGLRRFRSNFDNQDSRVLVQEVFLEPTNQNWLFGVDAPIGMKLPSEGRSVSVMQGNSRIFRTRFPITNKFFYRVKSLPTYQERLTNWKRAQYLDVSRVSAPRTQAIVDQIRLESSSQRQLVSKLMTYFATEEFRYTLSPNPSETIDQFMFETKTGFCEHFAAAFGVMLRFAGIPARLVVGFQGGEPGLIQDYIILKYSDAHAWVEYNVDGEWVRVDPTIMVAPDRIDRGGQNFFRDQMSLAGVDQVEPYIGAEWVSEIRKWAERANLVWDQADLYWTQFLLKYDFEYQKEFLKSLGVESGKRWVFVLFLIMGILALLLLYRLLRFYFATDIDPTLATYHSLLRSLSNKGFQHEIFEGPLQTSDRVDTFLAKNYSDRPTIGDLMSLSEKVFKSYIDLRYGASAGPDDLSAFKRDVRLLKSKL